jgi:hypothetical protein
MTGTWDMLRSKDQSRKQKKETRRKAGTNPNSLYGLPRFSSSQHDKVVVYTKTNLLLEL